MADVSRWANRNEGDEVNELELHARCLNSAVAIYKASYRDSLHARRFSAMFVNGVIRYGLISAGFGVLQTLVHGRAVACC